jgi:redox-sensitive bicupin YhaK (pirin superfamily)
MESLTTKDNNGGGGTISNGDTQWMTAGAGILHIETPPEHLVMSGGLFHGFQLWVNLPAAKKWSPPAYQDVRAKDVALLTTADGGSLLRVIAGEVDGHFGPGSTQTPITLIACNCYSLVQSFVFHGVRITTHLCTQ